MFVSVLDRTDNSKSNLPLAKIRHVRRSNRGRCSVPFDVQLLDLGLIESLSDEQYILGSMYRLIGF